MTSLLSFLKIQSKLPRVPRRLGLPLRLFELEELTYDGVDLAEAEAIAEFSCHIAIAGRLTVDLAIENLGLFCKVSGSMGLKVVCAFCSSKLCTPLTELFTRNNCKVC